MTDSTFSDIQANARAVLAEWNVGVGTGDPFDFGDFEVQAALNSANSALIGLGVAIERAQARYSLERAREIIERSEAVLARPANLGSDESVAGGPGRD